MPCFPLRLRGPGSAASVPRRPATERPRSYHTTAHAHSRLHKTTRGHDPRRDVRAQHPSSRVSHEHPQRQQPPPPPELPSIAMHQAISVGVSYSEAARYNMYWGSSPRSLPARKYGLAKQAPTAFLVQAPTAFLVINSETAQPHMIVARGLTGR